MKQFIIFFLLFLRSIAFGQIDVINSSVYPSETKILYLNHNNTLQISGVEIDSLYTVMIGNDSLIAFENKYHYTPSFKDKKQDTIRIYDENKIIHEEIFKIRRLSFPKVYYGELRDTFVTKQYLSDNLGLVLSYEPEIYIPCSYILSFEASIIRNDGAEYLFDENGLWEKRLVKKNKFKYDAGSQFSKRQLRKIKQMKSGEVILFKYVTVSCPSCASVRRTANLKLTIID